MIPHNIQFTNLYPALWRNLGRLTQQFFKERITLWVLLKNGSPVSAAIEGSAVPAPETVQAEALFEQYPQVRCIILAEEESLLQYYYDVNKKREHPVSADMYFSYVVKRLEQEKGIRYFLKYGENLPPPPWVDFFGILDRAVREHLPPTGNLLLEIMDGSEVWFQLAVTLHDYEILSVSTFDSYSRLLGLNAITEPLSSEQLKRIEFVMNEKMIYHRVGKGRAIAFLGECVKTYMEAER